MRRVRFLLVLLALTAGASAAWAGFEESLSVPGDSLVVRNLIGEVRVEGHSGSSFEVHIEVQGADGSRESVKIDASGSEINIVFPDEKRFIYPRLGNNSRTNFDTDDNGWLSKLFGRDRVEVRGSGSGLEIWADITIKVPRGADLEMRLGVGEIQAADTSGTLLLATRSGHVEAKDIDGNLTVDTGSGHVNVSNVRGELSVDTGSGHVEARRIEADRINIDTGSGHVKIEDVDGSDLRIDTGSGRVSATRIRADSADIDTGSGSVTLELDRMGTGKFRIDTGSGSITLRVPDDASAEVHADTGSGGIEINLGDGVQMRRMGRDEAIFTVGGGAAQVELDTGSGGIRISH